MEKGELDLFDEIAKYLNQQYPEERFSLVDIGSGDGQKARVFAEKVGEKLIKAYYPVDIQPIELAAALYAHSEGKYAKHPTLLDFANLSSRFPLKMQPNEKQFYEKWIGITLPTD
ncbi:MAG: L-histidine N(alpha)-methyltransferase [Candidatus Moraniibacteriota bacterium]